MPNFESFGIATIMLLGIHCEVLPLKAEDLQLPLISYKQTLWWTQMSYRCSE